MCSRDELVSILHKAHFKVSVRPKWCKRESVRYRPDKNFACMIALLTSNELFAHVVHSGWVLERDINWGWKYLREVNGKAVFRSFCSQKSHTLDFINFLNACFDMGFSRRVSGCGRRYFAVNDLMWTNQDLDESFETVRMYSCSK